MSAETPEIERDIYLLQTSLNDLRKHRSEFKDYGMIIFDNAIKAIGAGLSIIVSLWHSKDARKNTT